jgi:putative salt-induced outer membrane protein
MNKNVIALALCFSALFSVNAMAQTWNGQGEAGMVKTSGNTESESLNIGLDLSYTQGDWSNSVVLKAFRASNNDVESAGSISADYLIKRALNQRSNLFATVGYLDDDFDGFTEKYSLSVGYGYKLIDSEKTKWVTSLGIGYRDASIIIPRPVGDTSLSNSTLSINGATFVARSEYKTSLTDNTSIVDNFKLELGSDNSFFENEAALLVAMNNKFSLKVGFLVRHNTDPGSDSDKTDTITTLSLVYQLGN